jgi:hypothetical protein
MMELLISLFPQADLFLALTSSEGYYSLKESPSGWGARELEPRRLDIALLLLEGERKAATLTFVGGALGEPR